MAQAYAETLAMEKAPPANDEPPCEAAAHAQDALDDVKVVIPEGLKVRSHRDQPKEDPDAVIKKMQDDLEKNNFEKTTNLMDSSSDEVKGNLDPTQLQA